MTQERVRNILGQEIKVFVGWRRGQSRYAWKDKFFTKDCSQCLWCIGKEESLRILQEVEKTKGRRRWSIPSKGKIIGLCDWGQWTQVLYSGKLKKCEFFGKEPTRTEKEY